MTVLLPDYDWNLISKEIDRAVAEDRARMHGVVNLYRATN